MKKTLSVKCRRTGKRLSVKKIDLDCCKSIKQLRMEDRVSQLCRSPYIMRKLSSFVIGTELCVVLDEVDAISAASLREASQLSEEQVASIIAQTLLGLKYLHHNMSIVHCSVRAENVYVTLGKNEYDDFGEYSKTRCDIKLDGFHSAMEIRRHKYTDHTSSIETDMEATHWMPPELLKRLVRNKEQYGENEESSSSTTTTTTKDLISPQVDIWSLGITAIELVLGKPPYSDCSPNEALRRLRVHGLPSALRVRKLSPEFMDFVSSCLKENPSNRPTVSELIRHPFVSSFSGVTTPLLKLWQGVRHNDLVERGSSLVAKISRSSTCGVLFEQSAKDFNIQTAHLTSYDDDINFVDTNGAILIRSAVGKYDQHRQEARAILKESLRSMKNLKDVDPESLQKNSDGDGVEDDDDDDEKCENDEDSLSEGEPFFFPISTDGCNIRKRSLDTVDTVMSDAVQRCLAMYGYDGAQNSAQVTAALAQLQSALNSLESALPNSALSHNFLATCIHNTRNAKNENVRSLYLSPSFKSSEMDTVLKSGSEETVLKRNLLRRWKKRFEKKSYDFLRGVVADGK